MKSSTLSPQVWYGLKWFGIGILAFVGMCYCFHQNYTSLETTGKPVTMMVINAGACAAVCVLSIYKVLGVVYDGENWR